MFQNNTSNPEYYSGEFQNPLCFPQFEMAILFPFYKSGNGDSEMITKSPQIPELRNKPELPKLGLSSMISVNFSDY